MSAASLMSGPEQWRHLSAALAAAAMCVRSVTGQVAAEAAVGGSLAPAEWLQTWPWLQISSQQFMT